MDRVYLLSATFGAVGTLLLSRGIRILWKGQATLADALPVFGLLGRVIFGSVPLKGGWARAASVPLFLLGLTALAGGGSLLALKRFKPDELDLVMMSAATKLGGENPSPADRKAAAGEAFSGLKDLVLRRNSADAAVTVPEADLGPIAILEPSAEEFQAFTETPGKLSVVVFQVQQGDEVVKLRGMIERVERRFSHVAQVAYVDLDSWPELGEAQGVEQFPDVRFYRDGQKVDGFVGLPVKDVVLLEKFVRHSHGLTGTPAPLTANPTGALPAGEVPPDESTPPPVDPRAQRTEAAEDTPKAGKEPAIQPMKKDWMPAGMEKR